MSVHWGRPEVVAGGKTTRMTQNGRHHARRANVCASARNFVPASVHRPNGVLTVSIRPRSSRAAIACSRRVTSAQTEELTCSGAVYGSYLVLNLNETLWRPRLNPCTPE